MSETYNNIMKDNPTYTANQAIFVYHLRVNPHKREQIYMELDNEHGGMCALGLGMEAFGIIRTWEAYKKLYPDSNAWTFGVNAGYDPYKEIADKLGISRDHVNEIYSMNDKDKMTFGEIADAFEAYLKTDKSVGPRTLLRMAKVSEDRKHFEEVWPKVLAPVNDLISKRDKLYKQLDEVNNELSYYDELEEMSQLSVEDAWEGYGNYGFEN